MPTIAEIWPHEGPLFDQALELGCRFTEELGGGPLQECLIEADTIADWVWAWVEGELVIGIAVMRPSRMFWEIPVANLNALRGQYAYEVLSADELSPYADVVRLYGVYVVPERRGEGIARRLIVAALDAHDMTTADLVHSAPFSESGLALARSLAAGPTIRVI